MESNPWMFYEPKEKLELAYQLERLGVDIIEAGFAIVQKEI